MSIGVRGVLLAVLSWVAMGRATVADTFTNVDVKCPICETAYRASATGSETRFGQRLDLRPIGALTSPPRVAVCPKCGFVDVRYGSDYPKEELEALRPFVLSDEYQKMAKSESSYFRLARIDEHLKRPASRVAVRYLQASWQAEDLKQADRLKAHLASALAWYERVIAAEPEDPNARKVARVMKGELLRRLGRFDEARAHLEALGALDEFKAEPFPRIIKAELEFIQKQDDQPHEVPRP